MEVGPKAAGEALGSRRGGGWRGNWLLRGCGLQFRGAKTVSERPGDVASRNVQWMPQKQRLANGGKVIRKKGFLESDETDQVLNRMNKNKSILRYVF